MFCIIIMCYSCWVDATAFYAAVLAPLVAIIGVNTALFALVIKGMTCDRVKGLQSNQSDAKLFWLRVKAAAACFVLLGTLFRIAVFIACRHCMLCMSHFNQQTFYCDN